MRNIRFISYLFVVIVLCVACSSRRIYTESVEVPAEGWAMDSALCFNITVENTQVATEWIVFVRHTVDYAYQNFWLFLDLQAPDGSVVSDTVECYLADHRGRWLGNGWGALREMPILWKQSKDSLQAGAYTLKVRHGMRTEVLDDVKAIGLELKKID